MARSSRLLICVSLLLLDACAKSSVPPTDGGGSTGCLYGGNHYAAGHTFQSSDGCNECACDQGGNVACTARACVDAGPAVTLHWYKSCGAPVCGPQYNGPTGQPLCTTERVGDACVGQGSLCDPSLGCQVNLVCATSDPTMGQGGCPVSRARYKRDIRYLDRRELSEVAEQVLRTPLARWRYKDDATARERMGFIIEDVEPSPSVDGDQVNLYGYTSMAVAALQVQAEQIETLRRELAQLKRQLARRAPPAAPAAH